VKEEDRTNVGRGTEGEIGRGHGGSKPLGRTCRSGRGYMDETGGKMMISRVPGAGGFGQTRSPPKGLMNRTLRAANLAQPERIKGFMNVDEEYGAFNAILSSQDALQGNAELDASMAPTSSDLEKESSGIESTSMGDHDDPVPDSFACETR
jgi:hypothetical protein